MWEGPNVHRFGHSLFAQLLASANVQGTMSEQPAAEISGGNKSDSGTTSRDAEFDYEARK